MGGTGGRAHTGQWTLEARVSGRLPGAEGVQTGRESELSRQNLCQGARSVCSKAAVRDEVWLRGSWCGLAQSKGAGN